MAQRSALPELEWERLWKTILATCIRGQVERSGGDQAIWWERLKGVPFHPAGRLAYDKIRPTIPRDHSVPALPGEQALVESLAAIDEAVARADFMYRQSDAAQDALMSDPSCWGRPTHHLERCPEGHMGGHCRLGCRGPARGCPAHARCDGCCRWNGHGRARGSSTSRQYCCGD